MSSTNRRRIREFYDALLAAYGPQGWWPGETPTEIVIGAILTQNTNWKNVEKAIEQLRAAKMLDWAALRDVPMAELADRIRPSGYFNIKAKRLKSFTAWLWARCDGNLEDLRGLPLERLRAELLAINGIGPETADSILLYALGKPTFVIDAYTRRVAIRHGLAADDCSYEELKELFEKHTPCDVAAYNEYHALIVAVGKRHCGPTAKCDGCPLERFEHQAT
ncbi:MAG: endonuclease III domain-containing protein [Planctomycetes bacterium]|nr:endonuclease III domain-containing protein [Planctomycetota bacterium]